MSRARRGALLPFFFMAPAREAGGARAMADDECPVCLEDLGARLRVTAPCSHAVCLGCFERLPPPARCPLCRADLAPLVPPPPSPPRTPPPEAVVGGWARPSSETVRALAERAAAEARGELRRGSITTLVLRRTPSVREAVLREAALAAEAA